MRLINSIPINKLSECINFIIIIIIIKFTAPSNKTYNIGQIL